MRGPCFEKLVGVGLHSSLDGLDVAASERDYQRRAHRVCEFENAPVAL